MLYLDIVYDAYIYFEIWNAKPCINKKCIFNYFIFGAMQTTNKGKRYY